MDDPTPDAEERREAAAWLARYEAERNAQQEAQAADWSGTGVDDLLRRAEMNVVAYGSQEAMTTTFASCAQLQAWLDEATGPSPARLTAYAVDVPAMEADRERPLLLESRERPEPGADVTVRYVGWAVTDAIADDRWFDAGHGGFAPYVELSLEGAGVERYSADYCVDHAKIAPYLHADDHADATDAQHPPRWFGVHAQGTDVVVAFPQATSLVTVSFDGDGAWVLLRARHWRRRLAQVRSEAAFRERWADWLDPAVPLDDATLRAEIDRQHRALTDRIETDGDEHRHE